MPNKNRIPLAEQNKLKIQGLMIEKLPGTPTGCHTSPFQEITAVDREDIGRKMVIKMYFN